METVNTIMQNMGFRPEINTRNTLIQTSNEKPQKSVNDVDDYSKSADDIASSLRVDKNNTLENFIIKPGTKNAVAAIKGVVAGKRPIAMIYGDVGNGKTHLLHAAAIEFYRKGHFVRVLNFLDMLSALRNSINKKGSNYDEILDRYCRGERLIIDDIGVGEKQNNDEISFSDRIFETILCYRYKEKLVTIMSTNKEIDNYSPRVMSRLQDKSVCYLALNGASDFRKEK